MCEPTHSIVQYPPSNEGGTPTDVLLQKTLKERVYDWFVKIGGYFHLSKMGSGHSEATRESGTFSCLIPEETRYEAMWWDRTVKIDGLFAGKEFDRDLALEAATTYAQAVSIGSLTAFRRFLETSMTRTERPYLYVNAFLEHMLTKEGRTHATDKIKSALSLRKLNTGILWKLGTNSKEELDRAIKVVLGLTRQRRLLVPAWADDDALWRAAATP